MYNYFQKGGMIMVDITLICSSGMSTSILMDNMKEVAKQLEIEINIRAIAEQDFKDYCEFTNIALIAPQIVFKIKKIREKYEGNYLISIIDSLDYGMMDGKNILLKALKVFYEKSS
jgi:cellobiose PTS system EIIB component